LQWFQRNTPVPFATHRGSTNFHSVTFVTKFPTRHIQFVVGKWKTLEEILYEADVDCSAVAFDGKTVWATHRSMISFNTKTIVASPARHWVCGAPDYETRLLKYSARGFFIVDFDLKWNEISKDLIERGAELIRSGRRAAEVQGLRLIICGSRFSDVRRNCEIFKRAMKPGFKDDGLPYGPDWDAKKIRELLAERSVEEEGSYGGSATTTFKLAVIEDLDVVLTEFDTRTAYSWRSKPHWRYLTSKEEFFLQERIKRMRERTRARRALV
jgi:hypothetical protein